jgi:Ca2+-binding EF-hand superfamily protein
VAKSGGTNESITNYVNYIADSKGFVKKSTLIAILKIFGKYRPTNDAERLLRRLSNKDGLIPTATLIDFFEKENRYERGKLIEEDFGRVFDSFSR